MKTVREVIRRPPVWVNPEHTTDSAIVLMRGHNIGALPVLDGQRLVGMVLYNHLLGLSQHQQVGEVMMTGVPTLSPDQSVREAAELMERTALGRLPVIEGGRLIGVITCNDLLPEIGRSYDPLTELPWADTLREWAIDHLQRGMEITVLFLDIDRFGQFNKLYGHVIGDEVLQAVAQALQAITHPDTDLLCRFGGDEFCIATLRPANEAAELAARISSRIESIEVPSLSGAHITCTIGQFGGKRTREREHVHYAATLNSLINLASRDCMKKKPAGAGSNTNQTISSTLRRQNGFRLRLARVDVTWENDTARATVDLQLGPEEDAGDSFPHAPDEGQTRYTATGCAETDEEGAVRLVAETTFSALRGTLPEEYKIKPTDVLLNRTSDDQQLVTVVGQLEAPTHRMSLVGSALVVDNAYRAAAQAVLAAVNRPLGPILAQKGIRTQGQHPRLR